MKYRNLVNYLHFIDLFQQNVSLKLEGRYRISSRFGQFLSIGIIIFLSYNFFASDMIETANPIVLFQSFETKERSPISLMKDDFVMAFALTDESNLIYPIDSSYFTYNINKYSFFIKNGTSRTIKVNSSFCKSSYFNRFPEEFKNLNLSYASCPEDDEIFLKRGWDEDNIFYLQMDMYKCVNSSSNNVICKSAEEIDTFLNGKYVSLWIEQKNFDMQNYKKPIFSKLKTYYRGIQLGELKNVRLYIKKTLIQTDDSIIYSNKNLMQSYAHESLEYDSNSYDDKNFFFSFVLYSGTNTQIYQRKYQKLFDLIANLGGMLSSLTLICSLFVKLFMEWQINELIMNKLHFFINGFKKFSFIKPNFLGPSNKRIENPEKCKNPFKMTLCQIIRLMCKKKRKWTQKEELYVKQIKNINKKVDIIEILKKMQDIEKIKQIIFSEEQLLLFNSFNEKYIFPSKIGNKTKYHIGLSNLPESAIKKIENYTEKVNKGGKNVTEKDKRLLNLVENGDKLSIKRYSKVG